MRWSQLGVTALLFLAASGGGVPLRADTFQLADGRELEGDFLDVHQGQYRIRLKSGKVVSVSEAEVLAILRTEAAAMDRVLQAVEQDIVKSPGRPSDEQVQSALRRLAEFEPPRPLKGGEEEQRVAAALRQLGERCFEWGMYRSAAEAWYQVVRRGLGPKELLEARIPECWRRALVAAQERQDLAAVVEALTQLLPWAPVERLELEAKRLTAWRQLGRQLLAAGEWEWAREVFDELLKAYAGDPEALAGRDEAIYRLAQRPPPQEPPAQADQIRARLRSLRSYLDSGTDPKRLAQVRAQVAELEQELARLQGPGQGLALERYFPVRKGAWWRYRGTNFQQEVKVVDVVSGTSPLYRATLQMTTVEHPSEAMEVKAGPVVYQLERQALALYQELDGRRELRFKLPLELNAGWQEDYGVVWHQWQYVNLDARVTTRAGSFSGCLELMHEIRLSENLLKPSRLHFYFAPGVGLVKVEWAQGEGSGWELEQFYLPPES